MPKMCFGVVTSNVLWRIIGENNMLAVMDFCQRIFPDVEFKAEMSFELDIDIR